MSPALCRPPPACLLARIALRAAAMKGQRVLVDALGIAVRGEWVDETWYEALQAALVGIHRHLGAIFHGWADAYGCDLKDGWTKHIEGACGEMAVGKLLGRYWSASVNQFRRAGGDVPPYEVRTRSEHHYDLQIRDNDDPERVFILVTGQCPTFCVRGWLRAKEAHPHREWRQRYGGRAEAWFAPADALHPLATLPAQ